MSTTVPRTENEDVLDEQPISHDLILGTAGHIDHGKTSLVTALTGTETDRLPEEKKRGITIEPGYARLKLPPWNLGIVDVPGHEKFVRQMVAGAAGIDLVMLVVAANDSIKQQTREHLDILRILDLPAGVIALTKIDLVEPDWLELVVEEIRELVSDTFLRDCPIIPTSARTAAGLEDLKTALIEAAELAASSDRRLQANAPFKMPIDRAFTIEGHGTVVTGSVHSGAAAVGDTVEIQPGNRSARIRSVEIHDSSSEQVSRGQRAAINLSGVELSTVNRGREICAPGYLRESRLMTVKLTMLDSAPQTLRDGKAVRFHVGTAECLATVRLLAQKEIGPGETAFAQVFLRESAVAIWNQPFVIRRESPVYTIGGGRVLDPTASRIRSASETDMEMLRELAEGDSLARANASAYFHSKQGIDPQQLPRLAGIHDFENAFQSLIDRGDLVQLELTATRKLTIQRQRFAEFCERVVRMLKKLHQQFPTRFRHDRAELESQFAWLESREILDAAIGNLKREGRIELGPGSIGLAGAGPKLSKGERLLMDELVSQIKAAGMEPPTPKELAASARKNRDSVPELLRLAGENGDLIAINRDFHLHREVLSDVRNRIRDAISESGGLTMSELRQVIGTTRKYAIPLCEYLDSINFTRREGDRRVLGSRE